MASPAKASVVECRTQDGRYFVVRGRLWRCSDPDLDPDRRGELVRVLMNARRALRHATGAERIAVRRLIDVTKTSLGERGPVWWTDGTPDYNRRMAMNTPYAAWYQASIESARDV